MKAVFFPARDRKAGDMLLRDLLAMRDLRLRLLAGGDDVAFGAVNAVDLPEPGPYVARGDLVLTGLMWHGTGAGAARASAAGAGAAGTGSESFAAAVARAGASAVGAGEAALGAVPDDFVTACARHGLALFAVPADVPFSLISARVAAHAAAERERGFAALLQRSRGLVAAVAQGGGLGSAVSLLAADTGLSCHVLTPAGRVIAGAAPLGEDEAGRLIRGYLTAQRLPAVIRQQGAGWTVDADSDSAETGSRLETWLVACPGDSASWPPPAAEAVRALRAAAALERSRLEQGERLRRRLLGELIGQVLAGTAPAAMVTQRLHDLGYPGDMRYLVVAAEAAGRPGLAGVIRALLDDAVRHLAADPVTACHGPAAIAVVPSGPAPPHMPQGGGTGPAAMLSPGSRPAPLPRAGPAEAATSAGHLLATVIGRAVTALGRVHLAVGLSAPATAGELAGLLDEARYACRLAAARGSQGTPGGGPVSAAASRLPATGQRPVRADGGGGASHRFPPTARISGAGTVSVVTSEEIASHLLLLAMVPDEARRTFAGRVLGPVLAHDEAHHGGLLPTLRAFLDCSGSWTRSARRLHLHPNSVRYRIRQVERLTGRRLSRTEDRVDLYLALRALGSGTRESLGE
jgi:hypothetical protein